MLLKTDNHSTEQDAQKYLEFLKKFEAKKTTDDCYTPPAVYQVVREFVQKHCNIDGLKIIRPFFPGGNYQKQDYTEAVVIDNPPFSRLGEIIDFYIARDVKFFLFAPYLTMFNYANRPSLGFVIVTADVEYDNGAKVRTGFVTNLLGDVKVWGSTELNEQLHQIAQQNRVCLPKYQYPLPVLTQTMVGQIVHSGQDIQFFKDELAVVRGLDSQKPHKKTIYGAGFLISETAQQRKAQAQQRKAQAQQRKAEELNPTIVWQLSPREEKIIEYLSR